MNHPVIIIGEGIRVDLERYTIHRDDNEIHLSRNEWLFLQRLAQAEGRLVQWEPLSRAVWGDALDTGRQQGLRVIVSRIHRKLGVRDGERKPIGTVIGLGYRLEGRVPVEQEAVLSASSPG